MAAFVTGGWKSEVSSRVKEGDMVTVPRGRFAVASIRFAEALEASGFEGWWLL